MNDSTLKRHRPAELWFQPQCRNGLLTRQITVTVRLGRRDSAHERGYVPGERVRVRCRASGGPDLATAWGRIRSIDVKSVRDVKRDDLIGSPPSETDPALLAAILTSYYDRIVGPNDEVTIVRFSYTEDIPPAPMDGPLTALLERGVLQLAARPLGQPERLEGTAGWTVPILGHDYPARTPLLWNAMYAHFGLPWWNVAVVGNPDHVAEVIAAFRNDVRYLGGGAGTGWKEVILPHLDDVTELARAIGAVNIIRRSFDGKLLGHNTDGEGFARSLEQTFAVDGRALRGAHIAIIGASGSARAIAFALAVRGAAIRIVNRTVDRAEIIACDLERYLHTHGETPDATVAVFGESAMRDAIRDADAIVNASQKGTGETTGASAFAPIELPLTDDRRRSNLEASRALLHEVRRNAVIADIVLGEERTATLRLADEEGRPTLDGIPMVVEQAIDAFCFVHETFVRTRGIPRDSIAQTMWTANAALSAPATAAASPVLGPSGFLVGPSTKETWGGGALCPPVCRARCPPLAEGRV